MADFNAVAGHERIIKSLRESIKNDMTSHAYIFCGHAYSLKAEIILMCFMLRLQKQ